MRCPLHVGVEMQSIVGRTPFLGTSEEVQDCERVTLKYPITGCIQVAMLYDAEKQDRPRCSNCGELYSATHDSDVAKSRCPECRKKYQREYEKRKRAA